MVTKIAIFGAGGQMGRATQAALAPLGADFEVHAFGRDVDICDHSLVSKTLHMVAPNIVINAAAFTAVDACEADVTRAMATNQDAVANLAQLCHESGCVLIHLSTDYVFGDDEQAPLTEAAAVAPLNVYGRSKAAGEDAIRAVLDQHVIMRTSWIYGPDAGNFFATMMRLAATRDAISVVADEAACPTLARDLAACIAVVCQRVAEGNPIYGTFHVAGAQGLSRFAFANMIMQARADNGLKIAELTPITQAAYGAPARRPLDSRLDCTAFEKAYKIAPRGLDTCLDDLVREIGARHDGASPA